MQDVLTWSALIGAGGAIIATITFWINRGKAEAESLIKAESAYNLALSGLTKVELLASDFLKARLEDARDYVNHKDLAAAEARSAALMDGVRQELRGMNDRLDRVIEGKRA